MGFRASQLASVCEVCLYCNTVIVSRAMVEREREREQVANRREFGFAKEGYLRDREVSETRETTMYFLTRTPSVQCTHLESNTQTMV